MFAAPTSVNTSPPPRRRKNPLPPEPRLPARWPRLPVGRFVVRSRSSSASASWNPHSQLTSCSGPWTVLDALSSFRPRPPFPHQLFVDGFELCASGQARGGGGGLACDRSLSRCSAAQVTITWSCEACRAGQPAPRPRRRFFLPSFRRCDFVPATLIPRGRARCRSRSQFLFP